MPLKATTEVAPTRFHDKPYEPAAVLRQATAMTIGSG
jgi:hypothetical protein